MNGIGPLGVFTSGRENRHSERRSPSSCGWPCSLRPGPIAGGEKLRRINSIRIWAAADSVRNHPTCATQLVRCRDSARCSHRLHQVEYHLIGPLMRRSPCEPGRVVLPSMDERQDLSFAQRTASRRGNVLRDEVRGIIRRASRPGLNLGRFALGGAGPERHALVQLCRLACCLQCRCFWSHGGSRARRCVFLRPARSCRPLAGSSSSTPRPRSASRRSRSGRPKARWPGSLIGKEHTTSRAGCRWRFR